MTTAPPRDLLGGRTLQEQIRSNRFRSVLVFLGFFVLALVLAAAGGILTNSRPVAVVVLVGMAIYAVIAYFSSGKIIAAAAHAHPVTKEDFPGLYRAVENASIGAGLDHTPAVYVVDDPAPNAFAAGRTPETSYVAATTGLLTLLDRRELDGVMAHEMSHVRNRDVRLMTLAAVFAGAITLAADILLRVSIFSAMSGGGRGRDRDRGGSNPILLIVGIIAVVLAPIGAALLQMSLSRKREYLADASAVEITGDAEGLARALAALRDDSQPLQHVTRATAHLYIESPLRDHAGLRSSLGGMFDTHPPLEERIARLESMGGFTLPPPRLTVGTAAE